MYNNQYNPYQGYMQNGYNPYNYQQNAQNYQNIGQNSNFLQQNAQPLTQKNILQGKIVESEDIVKTIEVPLDGTISYFPTADGSEIITKTLQNNGLSKIIVYKRQEIEETTQDKPITLNDINDAINGIKIENNDDIRKTLGEIKDLLKEKKAK